MRYYWYWVYYTTSLYILYDVGITRNSGRILHTWTLGPYNRRRLTCTTSIQFLKHSAMESQCILAVQHCVTTITLAEVSTAHVTCQSLLKWPLIGQAMAAHYALTSQSNYPASQDLRENCKFRALLLSEYSSPSTHSSREKTGNQTQTNPTKCLQDSE